MSKIYQNLIRSAIFKLDAETAHGLSIKALKMGTIPKPNPKSYSRLAQRVAGLDFANPIGMAAGFDKNAEVPSTLLNMGFGFTEVGTITPLAQSGNPKPRIFRLPEDGAVINRLGFNNEGHEAALKRLSAIPSRKGILGVNIGANKTSSDMVDDYVQGIGAFYNFADYFTANISSPNTPGLRDLQARESLSQLLSRCISKRDIFFSLFWFRPLTPSTPFRDPAPLLDLLTRVLRSKKRKYDNRIPKCDKQYIRALEKCDKRGGIAFYCIFINKYFQNFQFFGRSLLLDFL